MANPSPEVTDRLKPCPSSPNCVSTLGEGSQKMEPIPFSVSAERARELLVETLEERPRTELKTVEGPYLHAVEISKLLRFKDDVEFVIGEAAGLIHFRSASRVGYSDRGVNRKRMEEIRRAWAEKLHSDAVS